MPGISMADLKEKERHHSFDNTGFPVRKPRHLMLCIHSPDRLLPVPWDPFSLSVIHSIALAEILVPKFLSNGEGAPPCGGQVM